MKVMKSLIVFGLLFIGIASCTQKEEETKEIVTEEPEMKEKLRHVVMFKFKETSSDEDIMDVIAAFENLPNEIKEIKDFEWGINNSPENLNDGLTHCFTLTFDSEEGRAAYLPHPAHKAFGEKLGPHLDKVTVVDYWTK
ncbi:MAG: Dabb family protein [Cytophagales bacterium]|nr:Dabb family protein [Cytophagales bacterium]